MGIHLHIPGIKGESADAGHSGWIDIDFLQFGGTLRRITSTTGTRYDRESANAEMGDIQLFRAMDSATPYLFLEACCGRGKTITIASTKSGAGTGSDTYVRYVLHRAVVSSYGMSARQRKRRIGRPMESLRISFTKMEIQYTPYDENNNPTAPMAVGFDTATNTRC